MIFRKNHVKTFLGRIVLSHYYGFDKIQFIYLLVDFTVRSVKCFYNTQRIQIYYTRMLVFTVNGMFSYRYKCTLSILYKPYFYSKISILRLFFEVCKTCNANDQFK